MTEHTPIPWRLGEANTDPNEGVVGEQAIRGADGYFVAVVLPCGTPKDWKPALTAANVALIVRAVNSHADMLSALEMVASQAGFEPGEEYGAAVITAIRRAKGEG